MERKLQSGISKEDWQRTGEYLREAIVEVANKNGGQEIAQEAIKLASTSHILPDPQALEYLEDLYAGSIEQVMLRAEQIQNARLNSEG